MDGDARQWARIGPHASGPLIGFGEHVLKAV